MIGLADVQGSWARTRLETPSSIDTTTRVSWMQAGPLHVDLRLPAEFESLEGAPSLASLDAEALRLLGRVEGFAGVTDIVEGTCTWTRRINYRGPPDGPDVGTLHWSDAEVEAAGGVRHGPTSPRVLIETGVHADYVEHWVRETSGEAWGRTLVAADGQRLVLCRAGDRFALGRADPAALGAAGTLSDRLGVALARGDVDALAVLFDMEFCCGRIDAGRGVIERSTDPSRPGDRAFGPDALDRTRRTVAIDTRGFDGKSAARVFDDPR